MANFDAGLASGYVLRLNVWESAVNAAANVSQVSWYLEIIKGPGSGKWAGGPHPWEVSIGGAIYSGSLGSYDFRGYSQLTIASGVTDNVPHNSNGTGSVSCYGYFNDNNSYGVLGDGYASGTLGLSTLTTLPSTPTTPNATYISDGQIDLNWTQESSGNHVANYNQVHKSVNGGAFYEVVNFSATNSANIAGVGPNQKLSFKVTALNGAGFSGFSGASVPVYTTPGTPSNVTAVKNAALNIVVAFQSNVAFTEHYHELEHGVVAAGGAITWDNVILTSLASGVTSYTHVAPNAGQVHIYRVWSAVYARNSPQVNSNSVQLLVAPNAPTVPAMPAFADKAAALVFTWVHNPIDSTLQTAYEFSYSTNGGGAWSTTGKVATAVSSKTIAASTYAANVALTMRVRTWGSATTGGAEGTGASLWANLTLVTFKTIPVASITSPANGSVFTDSTLRVTLGFTQAEAATFVKAQLELSEGATLVETLESSILVGITLATPVQNTLSYTVRARVQDSNGIWSTWVTSTFSITYLVPVPAGLVLSYLPDTGYGQLDLTIPAPGAGQAAATTVTITRMINGVEETVVKDYPVSAALTFLDTTPTIHGTNSYTVITHSAMGAQATTTGDLITEELRRAYLSKDAGFSTVVVFGANLSVSESLNVASDTVEAAGRTKPIGLYGVETSVSLKVSSFIFENFGSTIEQVRAILLLPGKACYRDASGRRVFGSVKGSVSYKKVARGDLTFTLTETS